MAVPMGMQTVTARRCAVRWFDCDDAKVDVFLAVEVWYDGVDDDCDGNDADQDEDGTMPWRWAETTAMTWMPRSRPPRRRW